MSSADSPRFDATAAAQQMLDLEVQAEAESRTESKVQPEGESEVRAGQPSLPAQQSTSVVFEQSPPSGRLARAAHGPRQRQAVRGDVR